MFSGSKKGSKRGQITLFVIVALVILFVFGFALYARITITSASLASQADVQLRDYISKNSINQYVTSCLDAVVDDVFLTTSYQGGRLTVIDDANNNYIKYYDENTDRIFNVSINVESNSKCPDGRYPNDYVVTQVAGLYPYNCQYDYLKNIPKKYKIFGNDPCHNNCTSNDLWDHSGFFGVNNMRVLCDGNGANAPGIVSNQNFRTCDYYDYNGNSMQALLQKRISIEVNKCINFTEIIKRSPSNITQVGAVKTEVIFGKEEFDIRLEYPFTVTIRNRQPVTKMVNFSVNRQLPFKELYEYTYELSNNDVMDATFDILSDKDKVKSKSPRRFNDNIYNPNYDVNIIRGDISNGYIDMVQVVDTEHKILGVPLEINLGEKNRRPALEYIHEGTSQYFDLATTEDALLNISPIGYDPDGESTLNYVYSGWREDYVDKYNDADPKCLEPTSIEYVFENCNKRVPTIPDGTSTQVIPAPHDWSKSDPYKNTKQNATYRTTINDIGFHHVTISTYDRNGLNDYQTIKILVMDLPVAEIKGSNTYDDVNSGYASYEDLYKLDGAGSNPGKIANMLDVELAKFEWEDKLEPFYHFEAMNVPNSKKIITIPNDLSPPYPSVTDLAHIVDFPFKKTSLIPPAGGVKHDITFTVTTSIGLQNSKVLTVNVMQCLNHRNVLRPPYPYDTLPPYNVREDDLKGHLDADHACCADDMTYKNVNSACYTIANYGMEKNFPDYSKQTSLKPNPFSKTTATGTGRTDNDVFKQEFIRYCSGDRGNICSGRGEDKRTIANSCDDTNKNLDQRFSKERCSGPAEILFTGITSNEELAKCANYGFGKTFEKLSGTSGSTGYCTGTTKQFASSPGAATFLSTTKPNNFQCNGQCDGSGGCTIATSCTCQIGGPLGNGNIQCNGLRYEDLPRSAASNSCGFGSTIYSDQCDLNCGLRDEPAKICRASSYGSGCTADLNCNGLIAGQYATTATGQHVCNFGTPTTWNVCGNDCVARADTQSQNVCRTGIGCTTATSCSDKTKGDFIGNGHYCNNNCQDLNCGKYAYNPSGSGNGFNPCYSYCNSDGQCSPGNKCCTGGGCGTLGNIPQGACY